MKTRIATTKRLVSSMATILDALHKDLGTITVDSESIKASKVLGVTVPSRKKPEMEPPIIVRRGGKTIRKFNHPNGATTAHSIGKNIPPSSAGGGPLIF
jgi:hypothetical protein